MCDFYTRKSVLFQNMAWIWSNHWFTNKPKLFLSRATFLFYFTSLLLELILLIVRRHFPLNTLTLVKKWTIIYCKRVGRLRCLWWNDSLASVAQAWLRSVWSLRGARKASLGSERKREGERKNNLTSIFY